MRQFQITSRPRHLRYVFFVDVNHPYERLLKLINSNQSNWGGRYNPIIPVKENIILEEYINLLKFFDPDYIFYSKDVNPETIKKLGIYNPVSYVELDDPPRSQYIPGVDSLYFLSRFNTKTKIISPLNLSNFESPLLDFYKLNFGLNIHKSRNEYEIGNKYSVIDIDPEKFSELNKTIHHQKPFNTNNLSILNLNTRLLRNLKDCQFNDFEIIIAKDKSSTEDLIYYWNRLLYECWGLLYITKEELDILANDKFFGGVLHDISSERNIHVTSMTLNELELEELVQTRLNPIAFNRKFTVRKFKIFPLSITDSNRLYERDFGESSTIQTLVGEKGLFHLPKLSFTDNVDSYTQEWVVDIEIKRADQRNKNDLKFPLTTETQYLIRSVKGRINLQRDISIIINSQNNKSDTLSIELPEVKNLLHQLFHRPTINGESVTTKFIEIGPHDSSNKLSAFLKIFKYDFLLIEDYFRDKFWVELFEDLITNNRIDGDSILFDDIKLKAFNEFKNAGIVFGIREETYINEENLQLGLKSTLEALCSNGVFFTGFSLKCSKCSSKFWYPLKDISDFVNCRGCLENFEFPIESKFSYKLNDIIKNNIFQSKNDRNGNLTVIRTLAALHDRSSSSFEFSPQLNLYDQTFSNKPAAEVDIICISDGQLIIGEAKHNSSLFASDSNKSLKSIVELAKIIRPDKIILSCYEDKGGKLEYAKSRLVGFFNNYEYQPVIETILLQPPFDQFNGHKFFKY